MVKDDRFARNEAWGSSLGTVMRAMCSTLLLIFGPAAFYFGVVMTTTLFAIAGGFQWWIWPVTAGSVMVWILLAGQLLLSVGVSRARVRWLSFVAAAWAAGPWLFLLVCFQINGWPD